MLERHLQKDCINWLNKQFGDDALVINIHGSGWSAKGCPDLLICLHGLFVACELKVGKNGLSEAQKIWKDRILKAGGYWSAPYTLEEFQKFIYQTVSENDEFR